MPYHMTHPVYTTSLNLTFTVIHSMHDVCTLRLLLQPKWQAISDKPAQYYHDETT